MKGKVYKMVVRPTMITNKIKRQEAKLEMAVLKMLSLGGTRMDEIRNVYMRDSSG